MAEEGVNPPPLVETEPPTLTETLVSLCATYMSLGMPYERFWHSTDYSEFAIFQELYWRKRDEISAKARESDYNAWLNGAYTFQAFSLALGNIFRKKGAEPQKWLDKPMSYKNEDSDYKERLEKANAARARIEQDRFIRRFSYLPKAGENNGGNNS